MRRGLAGGERGAKRGRLALAGRRDALGLRRALSDRLLPLVVGAMTFLGALALAGVAGAGALGRHWQAGAGSSLTVQVAGGRVAAVVAVLEKVAGVRAVRALPTAEVEALVAPWLGRGEARVALPLPGVVAVQLEGAGPDLRALEALVQAEAPGSTVDAPGEWAGRLTGLAESLWACAALAMGVVGVVGVAMVAVATRAGVSARRDAIEVVHGLGATDGYIAGRFARRVTVLVGVGSVAGAVLALPLVVVLLRLAAPFVGGEDAGVVAAGRGMPLELAAGLAAMPVLAAGVAWVTAQATVRRWLRRLP